MCKVTNPTDELKANKDGTSTVSEVHVPFFEMTNAQKRKHVWALNRDSNLFTDPVKLLEKIQTICGRRFQLVDQS